MFGEEAVAVRIGTVTVNEKLLLVSPRRLAR
jgi:hypothetical protein